VVVAATSRFGGCSVRWWWWRGGGSGQCDVIAAWVVCSLPPRHGQCG
jgi:hypothetical protein